MTAVIADWSAVSPFGIGRTAFTEGLRAGTDPVRELAAEWDSPDERAGVLTEFDARAVLGKKGTRSMDRVTALTVTAMRELTEQALDAERTAIVLGTTTGSAQSMMEFTGSSLTGAEPFHVDPALMPNVVMNCAAGRCGIWYGIKGPNTTVAGGRAAGLQGLQYAVRLLAADRADTVLCGAAEEYSRARAWLERHARSLEESPEYGAPLGEGAALFTVCREAENALAEILSVRSRVVLDGDPRTALLACLRGALEEAGTRPGDVAAVVSSGATGLTGHAERAALTELFTEQARGRVPEVAGFGDLGASSSAFGLAALLATPGTAGELAVLSNVDRDGAVGAAVLRMR
ncbi:beta-ketoacyl synthase N-terminal-like domain-containing protein [Sciscionella sediminilitoris]|uniref:beta-ketoacyl synthase N-terminal-like domain-containing protein n=1 Tax=Sciscionella sediminilitoris TaxID=1445613 RepID=UPI0004DFAF39|nr:beta-ketoacyl synthase N-terminal-like domain-containing protein [Sciscionella sp. SE31]